MFFLPHGADDTDNDGSAGAAAEGADVINTRRTEHHMNITRTCHKSNSLPKLCAVIFLETKTKGIVNFAFLKFKNPNAAPLKTIKKTSSNRQTAG